MFSLFSRLKQSTSVLVDPGCSNTVFKIGDQIKVIPSFVVEDKTSSQVITAGQEALLMLGKLPNKFRIIKPVKQGKIINDQAYSTLLEYGLSLFSLKLDIQVQLARMYNNFLVSLNPHLSSVDKQVMLKTFKNFGGGNVVFFDKVMLALIGEGKDVIGQHGTMVIYIGSSLTHISLVVMGGKVMEENLYFGGDDTSMALVDYIRQRYDVKVSYKEA